MVEPVQALDCVPQGEVAGEEARQDGRARRSGTRVQSTARCPDTSVRAASISSSVIPRDRRRAQAPVRRNVPQAHAASRPFESRARLREGRSGSAARSSGGRRQVSSEALLQAGDDRSRRPDGELLAGHLEDERLGTRRARGARRSSARGWKSGCASITRASTGSALRRNSRAWGSATAAGLIPSADVRWARSGSR